MEYLIPCKPIGSYQNVDIYTVELEPVGSINFIKENDYDVVFKAENQESFFVKSHPLKINKRFEIYNPQNEIVATVKVGVKIIHSIIEHKQYYFVKASFLKMYYRLFANRQAMGELKVVRKNKKRYFHITVEEDFVFVVSLFLLAHAVRIKSLMS